MPEDHPLHMIYRKQAKRYIKMYRSPMHELASLYCPSPDSVEILNLVQSLPAYEMKVKIQQVGVEEDISEANKDEEEEVNVYSDGSGLEGQVRAAAVLCKQGQGDKKLRYRLGPLTEHTVFEAEAVGVLLALHMLRHEREVKKATIWLDNQAVMALMGALTIHKPKPAQNIIDEIILQAENIWRRANHCAYRLDIRWVKGHSAEDGNEKVDAEAREAARGHTSQARKLPGYLTGSLLPMSISARQQEFDVVMKKRWRRDWEASLWHARISGIDSNMPSNRFRKLLSGLNRTQISILVQLRTGHIPLNKHLFCINKVESPMCPMCRQGEELVHHYLFKCMTWRHKRWHMGKELGSSASAADCMLEHTRRHQGTDEVYWSNC